MKLILEKLKQQHPSSGHFCYAWQLGEETIRFRTNDDGEPNNSAGLPIYGQIQSFNLTNILVVVVRYFGGTKLGVGGLIKANKYSAQITLENASVVSRTIDLIFQLTFDYKELSKVMRIIKEKSLKFLIKLWGLIVFTILALEKVRFKPSCQVLNSCIKSRLNPQMH